MIYLFKLYDCLLTVVLTVLTPIRIVTTLVLGFICAIPLLGMVVVLAISLIWAVMYGLIYIFSKLSKIPILGLPIGVAGLSP